MHSHKKPFLIFNFDFLIPFLTFNFLLLTCSYADYADGDGSAEFPFQIAEPNQLIYMSQHPEHWGSHFILTANINLALADPNTFTTALIAPDTDNSNYSFEGTAFTGFFYGNDHVISNLTIDTVGTGNDYLGLFGMISSSSTEVKNLGLVNIDITGSDESVYLGGLCGRNSLGKISYSYSDGSVIGEDNSLVLGGLCGNNGGTITNCYSGGAVTGGTGSRNLGGLCGGNNYGTIANCYATSSVTGEDYLGGLCGYNYEGTITNSFWDVETSGIGSTGDDNYGAIGKTTSEMKTAQTYIDAGWKLTNYQTGLRGWYIPDNSYPLQCWQNPAAEVTPDVTNMTLSETQAALTYAGLTLGSVFYVKSWQVPEDIVTGLSVHVGGYVDISYPVNIYISSGSSGNGLEANPYEIASQTDLEAVNDYAASYYIMTADIFLGYHITYTTAVITPDTSSSGGYQGTPFTGTFDGKNYIISNLIIDTAGADNDYLGLFGQIEDSHSEVKNLVLENVNITGGNDSDNLGGLCGGNKYANISNCYSAGSVTGGDDSGALGGLCGSNQYGSISNCYAFVSVTSGDSASSLGGFCGSNYQGSIINCYSTGDIKGGNDSRNLGGLCGYYNGSIRNCYATGSVSGGTSSWYLGGLVGAFRNGEINECFATGTTSSGNYSKWIGGLVGDCGEDGIISNSYAKGNGNGGYDSNAIGGLCGFNYGGNISNCYATGTVSGGDESSSLGGLVGNNFEGKISNCYAAGTVSSGDNSLGLGGLVGGKYESIISGAYFLHPDDGGGPDNDIGIPLTDPNMRKQSSFVGWDFIGESANGTCQIWQMPEEGGYPVLGSFHGYIPPVLAGTGTAENPYIISDPNELGAMYYYDPYAYYCLVADIDLTGIHFTIAPIPIFSGFFDGNQYEIAHLSVTGGCYLGLFGIIKNGNIENTTLRDLHIIGIDGSSNLGGMVGKHDNGIISNCSVTGSIIGGIGSYYLGGLVGRIIDGGISNCSAIVYIGSGYSSGGLGGLAGRNDSSGINNCYALGNIISGEDSIGLGGLCGYNYGSISNCHTTGYVIGDNGYRFGGICGSNYSGSITNCFTSSSIDGGTTSWDLGGIVGQNGFGCNISNSYATGHVSGKKVLGGIVGYNYYSNISNCYAAGSVTGSDVSDKLGGIVGFNDGDGTILASYFLHPDDGGGPDNSMGEPLFESEMRIMSNFVNWDFVGDTNGTDDHWQLCLDGYDYPRLAWQFINPADFLHPGRVDNYDLFVFTHDWLKTNSRCCDIAPPDNPDGMVNLFDYLEFSEYWLNE